MRYNWIHNLINAINEAREQIEKGQTLTNEEANDEIDKWLRKLDFHSALNVLNCNLILPHA